MEVIAQVIHEQLLLSSDILFFNLIFYFPLLLWERKVANGVKKCFYSCLFLLFKILGYDRSLVVMFMIGSDVYCMVLHHYLPVKISSLSLAKCLFDRGRGELLCKNVIEWLKGEKISSLKITSIYCCKR